MIKNIRIRDNSYLVYVQAAGSAADPDGRHADI